MILSARLPVAIVAGWLLVCPDLQAQSSTDSLATDVHDLDEIVVTGTRMARHLADTPVQTRLISRKEIERSDATDIRDLLQQTMPGVEFSYAMNQQVHLNFGGFGGQSILFLVDGERMAGETMDDVDFSRLNMAEVDHVEIVRGASSALYGSNAGGGVINIITREGAKKIGGNAEVRFGSHNDRRYVIGVSAKGKHVGNLISATASRVDSYDVTNRPDPASRVVLTIYGHRTLNVSDKLVWRPMSGLKLTGRAGFYMRELPRDIDAPDRYRSYSAGVRGEWRVTDRDNLELAYSFDQYDKSQWRKATGLDVRSYSDVTNSLRAFYSHTFGYESVLSAGADYNHEYLDNVKLSGSGKSSDRFDLFTQFDWRISERFEAVAALRYDYYSEGRMSRLTPKVSLRYRPHRNLTLRAAWGMGFRAPTLKEKYYEFDMAGIWIVEGNPSLRPEQSHNFDVSAEFCRNNWIVTATGYYNLVKDRIATGLPYTRPGDDSQLYLDYVNLDRYSSLGAELSARVRWRCGISANLSYAYIHERTIRDRDGNRFNSQYMPARPHSLTASVDWSKTWREGYVFSVGLNGRFHSSVENYEYKDYYNIDSGMVKVNYPAYMLCKLSASQTLARRVRITFSLDNIFNYKPDYYYLNAPLTDGIAFYAGIGVTI